jgi:hypothetical protein
MMCGYEIPGIIFLWPYLYTHSLLREFNLKVLPLSSYAISPIMVPAIAVELILW